MMNDNTSSGARYSDVLGENPSPEQLRLVDNIKALYSTHQPPQSVTSSVRTAIQERAAQSRSRAEERVERAAGPSLPWLRTVWRGLGLAGMASFALVVVAIAVGLAAVLSRMEPDATPGAPSGAAAIPTRHIPAAAPTDTDLPEDRLSPLLRGTGVLHIVGTGKERAADGDVPYTWESEFWYDRANGDARLEQRSSLGGHWIYLHADEMYSVYEPGVGWLTSVLESNSSGTPKPVEHMFQYKNLLDEGRLKAAVGVAAPSGQVAVTTKNARADPSVIYIDTTNGLTRRMTNLRIKGRTVSHVYEYPVIETLNRNALPKDLFNIHALTEVPPDLTYPGPDSKNGGPIAPTNVPAPTDPTVVPNPNAVTAP